MLIFLSCVIFVSGKAVNNDKFVLTEPYNRTQLQIDFGGMLHHAIYDIVKGFPADRLSIAYDTSTGSSFITHLVEHLARNKVSITLYNITTVEQQDEYFAYLTLIIQSHYNLYTLYFCTHKMAEHILLEIYDQNLIRRNAIYMFYWGYRPMYRYFLRNMHEAMKIILITNPRANAYRIYYNQATSHKKHHLTMYNWWIEGRGLFHHPTLPKAFNIFKNFMGRLIHVPVIHKPPWHFVHYTNDSLQVLGGRDDQLLILLSEKLNFKFEYFDPPERIQGSSFNVNGTFEGVLGLLWERDAEFFIGDVALTQERVRVVEFSFLTLADSGAFVTHAPSKLNEALALIRPFNWQVWPAIIITVVLSGPILYALIALPNSWHPQFRIRDHMELLYDCAWYTTGVFFKQTVKAPSESHKSRFFIILLAISATYVIGDMYAANLTSLLARPGREKPINNLPQLEEVMILKGYKLLVEKHSSSYSLLENGTGIYGKLWDLMTRDVKDPNRYLVDSVERGVKKVRDTTNYALMAGRETLYFDIQRFGPSNFHLSEKLNTAYSAVALQLGCPYKENFDKILMGIFEAGILTKMTQDEYENLEKQNIDKTKDEKPSKDEDDEYYDDDGEEGEEKEEEEDEGEEEEDFEASDNDPKAKKRKRADDDEQKLQPINIRMLQGAFYLLGIGHAFSGLVILGEILYDKHTIHHKKRNKHHFTFFGKIKTKIRLCAKTIVNYIQRKYRQAMNDAIVATFDYTE